MATHHLETFDAGGRGYPLKRPITIAAVFNSCSEGNIPLENFVHLSAGQMVRHAVALYQHHYQIRQSLNANRLDNDVMFHGLATRGGMVLRIWRLMTTLANLRPDVVHVHHSFSALLASLWGLFSPTCKTVVTVHSIFDCYRLRQKIMLLVALHMADAIVCNSKATLTAVQRVLLRSPIFTARSIQVIHNGVDWRAIQRHDRHATPPVKTASTPVYQVGTVGRLVEAKDHRTLLEAFARFKARVPAARLTIVGSGRLDRELRDLAVRLAVDDAVDITGEVERNAVYGLLGTFDVFVMSSRWEGFGNAVVEAMVAGVPVVVSRIPAFREIIAVEEALWFTPGDVADLTATLRYCHRNRSKCLAIGRRAAFRMAVAFSLERSTSRYAALYATLTGLPLPRGANTSNVSPQQPCAASPE